MRNLTTQHPRQTTVITKRKKNTVHTAFCIFLVELQHINNQKNYKHLPKHIDKAKHS